MAKLSLVLILLIFVLGLFLRLFYLPQGAITFGYDQARDAFNAESILQGDLKIQGPPASTPGLFHGALYYYLLAPAYSIGEGSPYYAVIWLSIINLLTIVPIFLLGKMLFNKQVGIIASFLFAISLDAVQYANWASNPAPAVLTQAIFYLGLSYFLFTPKKRLGALLAGLGIGLSVQFEVFLGYLFVPLFIALWSFKAKIKLNELLIFSLAFFITTSSMILSYFKFGLTFIEGFKSLYAVGGDPANAWIYFAPTLLLYLNRFAEYFYRAVLPFNITVAGLFGMLLIYLSLKKFKNEENLRKGLIFLLIMLFSHAFLIPFGGNSTPFINVGLQAVIFILVAQFIFYFYKTQKVLISLLSLLIVFSSLNANFKYNIEGQTIFAIQRGLTLKNEIEAVNYTYQSAGKEPFSINTVTSPLWINSVWAYLYNWHGKNTFGYLPSFRGRDQTGYLGELPQTKEKTAIFYLIIEPTRGIPLQFVEETISYEDSFSKVIEEKNFGGIVIQKRELTRDFDTIKFVR